MLLPGLFFQQPQDRSVSFHRVLLSDQSCPSWLHAREQLPFHSQAPKSQGQTRFNARLRYGGCQIKAKVLDAGKRVRPSFATCVVPWTEWKLWSPECLNGPGGSPLRKYCIHQDRAEPESREVQ